MVIVLGTEGRLVGARGWEKGGDGALVFKADRASVWPDEEFWRRMARRKKRAFTMINFTFCVF